MVNLRVSLNKYLLHVAGIYFISASSGSLVSKGSLHSGSSDTTGTTQSEHPRSIIPNEMKLTERDGGAHMKF